MDHVGWFGVVIRAHDFYQGYFIDDAFAGPARKAIRHFRRDPRIRHGSRIEVALDIPDPEDQSIVGGLSATVVEAAMGRIEHADAILATCGYALHQLTGYRFFWIEGQMEPAGTRTNFYPMKVDSIDHARQVLDHLPVVQDIQRRVLHSLTTDTRH